ncbi:MAG: hypothetical protein KA383_12395 [Phycisphaerae bacterium]|nr:hypothetical protein [Phycisphaerae bacterium]
MTRETFNNVEELILWSGFDHGASSGQASVTQGTFAYGQFERALDEARREIYRKTGQRLNDEFDEDRADELKEAERYLAIARLIPNYANRMQLEFPESNLASVGEVTVGADTPSPYEKGAQWIEKMYSAYRSMGLALLANARDHADIELGDDVSSESYPCLSPSPSG